MSNKIYNVGAFGIPQDIQLQIHTARLMLTWSTHAAHEIQTDRYGGIPVSLAGSCVDFKGLDWSLVEAETTDTLRGEVVTKFVVRRDIDAGRSLVLVIRPDGPGRGFVITAWINLTTDTHRTLNKNRFDRP